MSVIRDERLPDAPAVRAVLEAAFSQAVEADLVDKLRVACRERISLVACDDDRIVGHILFTPALIEGPDGTVVGYGLAPMAVLPGFQRKGIGSALVRAGIERLRRSRCPFVIVIGHPTYYPASGSCLRPHVASAASGTASPMRHSWSSSSSRLSPRS